MQSEPSAGGHPGKVPERFRSPETYVHWDRGLAIIAGIIGIVLIFFLLLVTLPIREDNTSEQLTGLADAPVPAATSPPQAAPARNATAPAPATGPDQPRLNATARQFPFVRRGPGINFAVMQNLQQGQRIEVVGRSPDRQWFQIVLPDNARERGWVSQEFLTIEGDVNSVPEVRE